MGKTGGTVRKQYKVLVDNLISVMEGKEPKEYFGGYTVCPLITDIGKVMLAEFDWTAKPTPVISFGLNTREMDLVVNESVYTKTYDYAWNAKW